MLVLSVQAKADMFSNLSRTNTGLFYSAGGYVYSPKPVPSAEQIINLGFKLANAGTCGGFNSGASLKGIFNLDAAQQFLKNVGADAIASAPMLLMSYASPTLANVFMHLKDSAERILAVRNQQCEAVERVAMKAGILLRAKEEGKYQCMMKAQKEGETLNEAVQHCLASSDVLAKYLPLTASNNNQMSSHINLAEDIKKLTGMDDEEYQLFHEAIGDITLNGNSLLDEERKDPVIKIYNQDVQDYEKRLTNIVDDVGFTNSVDESALEKIADETGVTILPATVVQLYDMKKTDPYAYNIYINMLANKLALHKLNEQILKIESELELAQEKANIEGNKDLAELLNKKARLELERKKILEKERAAEDVSSLLLQIHYEELAHANYNLATSASRANRSYYDYQQYQTITPQVLPKVEPGIQSVLKKYLPY